jgi:phosphohistidine swiveling domain-containing protein
MWLNVPDFIAIPTSTIKAILQKNITIENLCEVIREKFPQESYAVRSSCLNEDQINSSMAWQFHTELDVIPSWLESAIMSVIDQAKQILWESSSQISLIVQRYIDAEYSGVCFTRNPIAWREMIFEYHAWIWEDLVSGKIIPEKQSFYSHEDKQICWFNIHSFQGIETNLGHPQDIEWCIQDGILYYLQTRPITTISREKYQEILILESFLDNREDYYIEKNEISEVASRPTPFTFSFIKLIYEEDWPVMNVYRKHHMSYTPKSFLKIIGNELYIDREQELHTLLPAFSTLNTNYIPKIHSISGLWQSMKNIFYTTFLNENKSLIERLQLSIQRKESCESFELALDNFMREYETIFEVNIFAARSLKKLELLIKNERISIAELLQSDPNIFNTGKWAELDISDLNWLIWNTLEISDTTEFYHNPEKYNTPTKILEWWDHLPEWKKQWYGRYIAHGIRYQQYREHARVLMIKNINTIRNILIWVYWLEYINTIYFSSIDEILSDSIDQEECDNREQSYLKNNTWNFPSRITKRFIQPSITENTGISPWTAEWYLVDIVSIKKIKGPKILKVQILAPNLTEYFPDIVGIISEKWWLLSHLAIIARERGIPVVISSEIELTLWSYISIDGSNGAIKKI